MDEKYNDLESQIGDLGGDVQNPLKGRKLTHKAAYGAQEDLTDGEQESMDKFLKRTKKVKEDSDGINKNDINRDLLDNPDNVIPISQGWIPIDKSEMGKRAMFYPESYEFYVRPATVQAIKNWTAIDEERYDVINKVFNEIIKMCVKITDNGVPISWGMINSWDRFWFILKVREYTFANGESSVEFEDTCSECEGDVKYELKASSLFYEFPDDDIIEKYWDGTKWVIDPREYDVDHDVITLYTPKICKDEAIIEWATERARTKQKKDIDETFIKFLVWMLNKPAKDMAMLDRQIKKCNAEYKSWDINTFNFINDVVTNINIDTSEKMRCICPHCGREATSNVQFPNGVKILFTVETKAKKFGSRVAK